MGVLLELAATEFGAAEAGDETRNQPAYFKTKAVELLEFGLDQILLVERHVKLGADFAERKTCDPPVVPEAIFVNPEAELLRRLPDRSPETYNRAYAHWRGDPPVQVDGHPNPAAHRIIAEEIVKAINDSKELPASPLP